MRESYCRLGGGATKNPRVDCSNLRQRNHTIGTSRPAVARGSRRPDGTVGALERVARSGSRAWQRTTEGENAMTSGKRLYRSRTDKKIAGVCGGFGNYFGMDPVIFRVVWVLLILGLGAGIVAYLICWLIIPLEPATATQT